MPGSMDIKYKLRKLSDGRYEVVSEGANPDVAYEAARSLFIQDGPFDFERRTGLHRFTPQSFVARHFDRERNDLKPESAIPRVGRTNLSSAPEATIRLWNDRVSLGLYLSEVAERRAWLVLALFLAESSIDVLSAPPQYESDRVAEHKKAKKALRRGALIALGVVVCLIGALKILIDVTRPISELNHALRTACDRYLADASREPGLFAYLKSRKMCRHVVDAASSRWKKDEHRTIAREAVFDTCLLLATDPTEPDEDEDLSIPRYDTVPAHFAREYVDKCEAAGREIASDITLPSDHVRAR